MRKLIILAVLVLLLGGAGFWYWRAHAGQQTTFRTAEVTRGPLLATISATGTLQPQEVVDVGAQVAGPIKSLGKDPDEPSKIVDWGTAVKGPPLDQYGKPQLDKDGNPMQGTLLAQIDPAIYQAQFDSASAALDQAKADLLQKQALVDQSENDWDRAKKLKDQGGISQAEYDSVKATYETAAANKRVSEAQIGVAKAAKELARTNLGYTKITSPVNGIIIDRRVNVGQTVVASLSAPSLFLIAKDLTRMEVWATVNEVDVGKIFKNQKVRFTVDAYPGKVYDGEVKAQGQYATRLNASMTQNVVTYTVVVSANNESRELLPYLTANLSFIVADKPNALLVPNAALRWQPSRRQIAPEFRDAYSSSKGKKKASTDADVGNKGVVWVKTDDGHVRPIKVSTGLSDTVNTEILEPVPPDLTEGAELVVGEGHATSGGSGGNPFTPQIFKPKPKD